MKIVDTFPRAVRDIENVFIPLTADEKSFHIETEIEGFEGDERVFEKRFRSKVPRDLT